MNNLEFSNLIHGIIQTKFPKLENRLEIIIESRANNDQIYGSGIDQNIMILYNYLRLYSNVRLFSYDNEKVAQGRENLRLLLKENKKLRNSVEKKVNSYLGI